MHTPRFVAFITTLACKLCCVCLLSSLSWAAESTSSNAALSKIFEDERSAYYAFDVLSASAEGRHEFDARMPSVTPAAQLAWQKQVQALLDRSQVLSSEALSTQERLSLQLFQFMLRARLESLAFREWRTPFNSDSGFFSEALYIGSAQALNSENDYQNYLKRLADFPRYFAEQTANLKLAIKEGAVLPRAVIPGLRKVVAGSVYTQPEQSPLFAPFKSYPNRFTDEQKQRLNAAAQRVFKDSVLPAYADFNTFFAEQYAPAARKTLGASQLPDGKRYYASLLRYYTTLPEADAEQIHQIGLAEVKRIRAEMHEVMRTLQFKDDLRAFLTKLRTDPQFYFTTPEALLERAAWISKTIDGQLPRFFVNLPRTPYTVKPVPEALAPNYTAGRYNGGPTGAAGEYWVNTYALPTRAAYSLPALTLHEAVPGHHLQGAMARELTDLPQFRLNFYPHAFGEGWALYSEKLGTEMSGVYVTPYDEFGRLSYEMWRACRLVVDTGLHAKGWSKAKAIDYLTENTALSSHEIGTEVDRYISWPGQAVAYKMGELKIIELRKYAQEKLRDNFDLRLFHQAVLENGGVTLPVLQERIEAFVARAQLTSRLAAPGRGG